MLTNAQKSKFGKLKSGELTHQESADLYYRVSKNMKRTLINSIKETVDLIDEMPEKSLEKIDLYKAANNCLDLLTKLVTRLEPVERMQGDNVVRFFRVQVNNALPDVVLEEDIKPTISVAVTYMPDDSEKKFLSQLRDFLSHAKGTMQLAKDGIQNLPTEEFNKKLDALKGKQDLKVRYLGPGE
jgi:hypothetical protein